MQQWQKIEDEWMFGEMVRGIVRNVRAVMFWQENEPGGITGRWCYFLGEDDELRETHTSLFQDAIAKVEGAMGIEG